MSSAALVIGVREKNMSLPRDRLADVAEAGVGEFAIDRLDAGGQSRTTPPRAERNFTPNSRMARSDGDSFMHRMPPDMTTSS